MNINKILKSFGLAVLAFALGTQAWSQPVTTTIQTQTITLTEAQISNPDNARITVVSAPGAGKMNVPLSVIFQYHFNGTPYTINTAEIQTPCVRVSWGLNDDAFFANQVGLLDQSENIVAVGMDANVWQNVGTAVPVAVSDNQTALVNQPLTVSVLYPATGGNGTLTIIVTYEVVSLN